MPILDAFLPCAPVNGRQLLMSDKRVPQPLLMWEYRAEWAWAGFELTADRAGILWLIGPRQMQLVEAVEAYARQCAQKRYSVPLTNASDSYRAVIHRTCGDPHCNDPRHLYRVNRRL